MTHADSRPPSMRVEVQFEWDEVGEVTLDALGRLAFPPLPTEPGIYRFRLVGRSTSNHIGEAVDLRRRANGYRVGHPRQRTNHRMNRRMREHLQAGGRVEVAIAVNVVAKINGRAQRLDLHSKKSRLLAESAALHLVPDAEPLENLPGVGEQAKPSSKGWDRELHPGDLCPGPHSRRLGLAQPAPHARAEARAALPNT